MKITLIITTYNWPESLYLVLQSVRGQLLAPYEIIIADDGSDYKTKDLIKKFNKDYDLNIIHSWQEDNGFRAARSRNQAISNSNGDYIVLIDGDTILHPRFLEDHMEVAEDGFFVQGSRMLLSENETQEIISSKEIKFPFFSKKIINKKISIHSKLLSVVFSSKKNHFIGIKSCNMAFFKDDCIQINGFNNDFEGWGREDSEFVLRLMNYGIRRNTIRFRAIQYHLWHHENSRKSLDKNDLILNETINRRKTWCKNGLNSIKKYES